MKILREFSRLFVGGLFIFSGLIKINDPVGTQIKLEEYFDVFAYDIASFFSLLIPAALFLSVFLCVLEVALGLALLLGYRVKEVAWALLGLIIFFTFLTFYSAYFNKVTDCGCFGDAIKLTPWQSFYKDIILFVFIGVIFLKRNEIKPVLSTGVAHGTMIVTTIIFTALAITAINHLPFIDFRAYKIGNNIAEQMRPSGELRYEYILQKDGKEYRFEKYPEDPGYTFVKARILNPEVQPKISDFAVWNDEGDYTDNVLTGNKLLIIIHNSAKASEKANNAIRELVNQNTGMYESWILTSSAPDQIEKLREAARWDTFYYFADATVLKTMIRSNPGIVLLKNGTVVGQWHYNDCPSLSDIRKLLN